MKRSSTSHSRLQDAESGQVTVLSIGLFIVVGLLVVVVVNSSAAFLERQRLNGMADSAALAAADGLDRAAFYGDGTLELDAAHARRLAADHLAGVALRAVHVTVAENAVTVRLEREVEFVWTPPGFPRSSIIVAEATSRLLTQDLG